MRYDWIINKLKENTEDATKEVIAALENATVEELKELGCDVIASTMAMQFLNQKSIATKIKLILRS